MIVVLTNIEMQGIPKSDMNCIENPGRDEIKMATDRDQYRPDDHLRESSSRRVWAGARASAPTTWRESERWTNV